METSNGKQAASLFWCFPLPSTAHYWSTDEFLGNTSIQKVMSKNRFEEISRFLHLNDSTLQPQRGEDVYDRLYKVRPNQQNKASVPSKEKYFCG